jgi:hypothetical protein
VVQHGTGHFAPTAPGAFAKIDEEDRTFFARHESSLIGYKVAILYLEKSVKFN